MPRTAAERNDEMQDFPEYELAGIETIARGICVQDGKVLLCRAKGGATTYLPGGHIEFGEKGCEALAREMREEMGVDASVGAMVGVVENQFVQHGKFRRPVGHQHALQPFFAGQFRRVPDKFVSDQGFVVRKGDPDVSLLPVKHL